MKSKTTNPPQDSRYQFGRAVLGPIFSAFAHLLLTEASEMRVRHLAFVARDGEFLMRVVQHLATHHTIAGIPECAYIYLSRISTALPGQRDFSSDALAAFFEVHAGIATPRSFLAYFGLGADMYLSHLDRHGLTLETPTPSASMLAPLVRDPNFLQAVAADRKQQMELLAEYLRQERVIDNPHCALVDIGWRGSIPEALANVFKEHEVHLPALWFLLGHWNEFGTPATGGRKSIRGLLTDQQRSRGILEGAAHYLAMLLEAISRADHGTVVGYCRESSGRVAPVLSEANSQRHAEKLNHEWREPIRRGILDFSVHDAAGFLGAYPAPHLLRRATQRRMLRIAFFPNPEEIRIAQHLVHTEGHTSSWGPLLLDAERPSPYRNPRKWLAGLASPWRGAYVAATGGIPASLLYFLSEIALSSRPASKRWLRTLALRVSGGRHGSSNPSEPT